MTVSDRDVLRSVGPEEVTSAGELAGKLGSHNKGEQLIRAVAKQKPREVVRELNRREDPFRTLFLQEDEVREAADAAFEDHFELIYARVRGRDAPPEKMSVAVLLRDKETGRTARGIIPYKDLKASVEAYERAADRGSFNPFADEEDREEYRKALSKARTEARRTSPQPVQDAVERNLAVAEGAAAPSFDPEAVVDGKVSEVKARLRGLSDEQLDAVRDAEMDGKGRKSVLSDVEGARS